MQGHILLTRHYLADGYDGYGYDEKLTAPARMRVCVCVCVCVCRGLM